MNIIYNKIYKSKETFICNANKTFEKSNLIFIFLQNLAFQSKPVKFFYLKAQLGQHGQELKLEKIDQKNN